MIALVIYTFIIIGIIICFLYTYNYKKEFIHKLDRKENPLYFLFGLSAFILDKYDYIFNKKSNYKIYKKLEKLNVGKEINSKVYCFRLNRLSISLVIFIVFITIGCLKYTESIFKTSNRIKKIERPEYGEGSTNYYFTAELENGETEKVEINLKEKMYNEKEIYKLFDDAYPIVVKKLLGDNKTVKSITSDLNFISNFNGLIDIAWNVEEEQYIDYTGKIQWNNISENINTTIEAVFFFENVSKTYLISISLDNDKRDSNINISEELQEYIKDYSPYDKEVELPEYINEKKVKYVNNKEEKFQIYFILAISLGVAFYFAKNKDLEDKLKKRQEQLEIDYVTLVNKMSILHSSGMTVMAAWDKILSDYDKHSTEKRYVYEEMKVAKNKLLNGYSETDVILEFGKQCELHQYIKFSNLLEQNIKKGTKGLKDVLRQEVNEANEMRRILAIKKGDAAGTKLLLPMGIMLIISIIMIIMPAFMSMSL